MRYILTILLITVSLASVKLDLTGQVQQYKVVNGNAYYEVMAKSSVRLREFIPIIYKDDILTQIIYGMYFGTGFSQTYSAPRASIYSLNHLGHRIDFSIGVIFGNFEAIYTHSVRDEYSGASPTGFFFNQDVDSIKLRYKTTFEVE